MQNHPGLFYYPSLHDNGRVRFPVIDSESSSVASHLPRYITASYLMIYELARELSRARSALASARSVTTPASVGFTPYIPASSRSPVSLVTPPSSSGTATVSPLSAPAEWVSLLATPVAPMIHPPPTLEGEPLRQRRRVALNPEVSVNPASSGSESASGEDPQRQPSSRAFEYSQSSGWSTDVVVRVMMFHFMYEGSWTWHVVIFHV